VAPHEGFPAVERYSRLLPPTVRGMAAMDSTQDVAVVVSGKKWRGRSIASLLLFILAVVLTPAAFVGHWAHTTVTDTQVYLAVVEPLAENPEIQEAVGKVATDAVIKQIDTKRVVGGFLENLLPNDDLADALTGPLSAGVNQVIGGAVRLVMSTDAFQAAWDTLNRAAQRSLIAALDGDPKGVVQVKGPNVVLDISSLLEEIQKSLVDEGIGVAAQVKIPQSDSDIVLMSAPAFEQLRTIWSFANPVLNYFLLAVAVLFAVAVLLALRRARTTAAVGIAIFVIGAAMRLVLPWAESRFTNAFTGSALEGASIAFFQALLANLIEGLYTMMLLGVMLMIGGWFIGHSARAVHTRASLSGGFADLGSRLPEWSWNIGRPLREHAPVVRWGLLFLWLIAVFTAAQFHFESTLGWTALFLGLLVLAELLMSTPGERVVEEREQLDVEIFTR
jgi:hypothetical protein